MEINENMTYDEMINYLKQMIKRTNTSKNVTLTTSILSFLVFVVNVTISIIYNNPNYGLLGLLAVCSLIGWICYTNCLTNIMNAKNNLAMVQILNKVE